jgi:hypothetical protein
LVKMLQERDLVGVLLTTTHCFSSRLNALRNCRKVFQKAIKDDQSAQNTTASDT